MPFDIEKSLVKGLRDQVMAEASVFARDRIGCEWQPHDYTHMYAHAVWRREPRHQITMSHSTLLWAIQAAAARVWVLYASCNSLCITSGLVQDHNKRVFECVCVPRLGQRPPSALSFRGISNQPSSALSLITHNLGCRLWLGRGLCASADVGCRDGDAPRDLSAARSGDVYWLTPWNSALLCLAAD